MTSTEQPEGTAANNNNPLEQFVQLAKSARGAAAVELIKQVIAAPGVYVFGELLSMPRIKELETGPTVNYYNTLSLFAYGTYRMYLENKSQFMELGPIETRKLQHLTIVTLATELKCIPYSILLKDLDIKNVRDLEDLIIEAIYADIIHGKLDQKNSQLELDYAIGRDTQPSQMGNVIATLQEWCDSCEAILGCVETQINRANSEKNRALKHKDEIEQEVINIKKALKTQTHDTDEAMATDVITMATDPRLSDKTTKKTGKTKPMRTGTKFWQK